ncbi:unnamed protein product, partial [Iphiclides podalirius]
MALNMKFIFLFAALIAANLIFAQESSDTDTKQNPPADNENGREHDHDRSRTFFTRFVSCNSTAQAGRTCANCRQTLLCLSNNIGILKTCHGLLRYCNQGRCSFIGGSACNGTSSG